MYGPINHRILIFVAVGLGYTLSTHPAKADDDVHRRAQCAQVEMAEALGERVDPREKAACEGRKPNKPTALIRSKLSSGKPEQKAIPPILQELKPKSGTVAQVKVHRSKPAWVDRIPSDRDLLYGVGTGAALGDAFPRAAVMIAAQLQVRIDSTTTARASSRVEEDFKNGQSTGSRVQERQYVSESAQMMVKGALEDIRIEDQYTEPSGAQVHVLAVLDLKALQDKQDNLLRSVLQILSRATERFVGQMHQNKVIHQESLFELVAVLEEVNALGHSKLGKKVRKKWRKDYRKFKRLVEKAIQCIDVDATFYSAKGKPLQGKNPVVSNGEQLRGTLLCRGLPVSGARIKPVMHGGIADLPQEIETDKQGRFRMEIHSFYGQNRVKLHLQHSLVGVAGAHWISQLPPSPSSTLKFKASRAPVMKISVSGLNEKESEGLYNSLSAFAKRKWGATIQKKGSTQLEATARVDVGNVQETGEHFVQSAEMVFTVQNKGNTIFEERLRKGSLGENRAEARTKTLNNLMQALQRW